MTGRRSGERQDLSEACVGWADPQLPRCVMRRTRLWVLPGLVAGILAGVVAVSSAGADEKPPPPTRGQLASAQNNLKQIVLAIINSADTNRGAMPSNSRTKDGKALLSWRVAILPYLEQVELYKQFKLDEPWDSDNNKKLIEKMPKLYAPIRVKAKEGETFYQVFSGPQTLHDPKRPARYPASIADGTSNTGLVFEAGEPVIWTKPEDLVYDPKKPLPRLGGLFDGQSHVGMCDGAVMRLKKDPDETELRKLILPADGEVLDIEKLRVR
jgi:hypothetical protein